MSKQLSKRSAEGVSLRVGQPFNPFGLFNGIFIPEALVRATGISPGAKIALGRLARYAGENGDCYPSVPTLAGELGMSERQIQRYVAELERVALIRRVPRVAESGQTSNVFVFLWHSIFAAGVTDVTPQGVTDMTPEAVTDPSPKESQSESQNIDLDSPPTNRKKRDSRLDCVDERGGCKQYRRLGEALTNYMATPDDPAPVCPSDRHVVDVMDAAAGASEDEVIQCLRYLKEGRGLRPGTRHGPRSFAWFKTVVADYFQEKRNRGMVFVVAPSDSTSVAAINKEEFDSMSDAF